jgi:predicted metal-dependent hydrolase
MTDYTLIRSARRTLALEVTRDLVVIVRAPRCCPRREIDEFVSRHADWIKDKLALQRRRQAAFPEPTEAERLALIQRAREELPSRIAHYAGVMGLSPAGITITGARTRFGSCSPKNQLCFSWRLMRYPDAAVDYVVVHELAHIVHKNHSQAFHALVASVLPDHKARRRLLKEGTE